VSRRQIIRAQNVSNHDLHGLTLATKSGAFANGQAATWNNSKTSALALSRRVPMEECRGIAPPRVTREALS
jgi:hypothetical protein